MKRKGIFAAILTLFSAFLITFALTFAPQQAKADNWVLHGADLSSGYALDVDAGFPNTIFRFHIPISAKFEINPFVGFNYWGWGWGGGFGNTFGAQLKMSLLQKGNIGLSLNFDVGLTMNYHPGFIGAIDVGGPELRFHYNLGSPRLAFIVLFKMPISFYFSPAFTAQLPFMFQFGMEFNVIPQLNIFFKGGGGPSLLIDGHGAIVHGVGEGHFGISYMF